MAARLAFTTPPHQAPAPETGGLLSIADAVRHHRPISIRYTADGRRSQRTLHPYGFAHCGRWYVAGADPGMAEERTFRLDRIHASHRRAATQV